jgi:hypothetical protein
VGPLLLGDFTRGEALGEMLDAVSHKEAQGFYR